MSELPKKVLGTTGLEVTTLGYGAMELRGGSTGAELNDAEVETMLNTVLDSGINFIDTSPDYGLSEERIGQFISGRRSEYYLASKCGCPVSDGIVEPKVGREHIFTAKNVRAGVEQSLRRMKTEYLDVLQFHASPDKETLEKDGGLAEALKLKEEGKVRFLGMSGTLPNLPEQMAMGVFEAYQIPYSALQREHEAVIGAASLAGSGIIIRGGVARGGPTDWEGRVNYMLPGGTAKERWEGARLDELLDGMGRMEFTLRFTLSNPDLDTTIVGTKSPDHLKSNIEAAMKGPLPTELMDEARHRLTEAGSRPA